MEAWDVLDTIWNGHMYWVVHGAWKKTKDGVWRGARKKGKECRTQELETGK